MLLAAYGLLTVLYTGTGRETSVIGAGINTGSQGPGIGLGFGLWIGTVLGDKLDSDRSNVVVVSKVRVGVWLGVERSRVLKPGGGGGESASGFALRLPRLASRR